MARYKEISKVFPIEAHVFGKQIKTLPFNPLSHNKDFLWPYNRSLLKTLLLKEKMLSHNIFYATKNKSQIFYQIYFDVSKHLQVGTVKENWFIDCIVFHAIFNSISVIWLTPFSIVFQSYHCNYPCFPGVFLTSIMQNVLPPATGIPHNHCWNKRQRWERNESCHNVHHQSSERISADPGDRTSDLLFSSHIHFCLSYGAL